ncbi:hypothetical protein ACSG3M_004128 [Vibrio vulnificus]
MKTASFGIIFFLLSPLIVVYFSSLDTVALWIYLWMPAFLYLVLAKSHSPFIRGLVLIGWTVFISMIGTDFLIKSNPELKSTIQTIIGMLGMIAGGVGGNFMAHELIQLETAPNNKRQKK